MSPGTLDLDQLLPLAFGLRANPGAYALLLGAGVSAPSGIPTAWGVLEDLTRRVAVLKGDDPEDPIRWFEDAFGEAPSYSSVLERLARTKLERQRILRGYFEPDDGDAQRPHPGPTTAHRAIARLVRSGAVRVVMTLNFDRLVEQALRAEGVEPTVIATPGDIVGMAPLHTIDCCVIHLHGDYLSPVSMLNTATELRTYRRPMAGLLRRVLEDYGLVIAGWSANYDPALREAITTWYPGRLTMTWIEPYSQSDGATRLLTLKRALVIPADADTALGTLADAVESMRLREARHPLTVPVAVETAKRELAGRWVAIGLHDTIGTEFTRLHALGDFHLPDHQSSARYGGWDEIKSRVREASSVVCALTATLAYWGDDRTDSWWLDELPRFSAQIRGSGETHLLRARLVAGASLFWSAGVAAVAARRYGLLRQLINLRAPALNGGGDAPIAVSLSEYAAGVHRHVVPLLTAALVAGPERLDDAWQRFEILRLAALAMAVPDFGDLAADEQVAAGKLAEANLIYETAVGEGTTDSGPAQTARRQAWEAHSRALGKIANGIPAGRPHILVVDRRANEHYPSPVAESLLRDLDAEASSHALITSGFAIDPADLSSALRAVNLRLGAIGHDLAWSSVSGRSGIIPSEVWIDTGETPEERRAAQGR